MKWDSWRDYWRNWWKHSVLLALLTSFVSVATTRRWRSTGWPVDGDYDIDPEAVAELSARFELVERQQSMLLCTYCEMTFDHVKGLVDAADAYYEDDWGAIGELVRFSLSFAENARTVLYAEGLLDPDEDED